MVLQLVSIRFFPSVNVTDDQPLQQPNHRCDSFTRRLYAASGSSAARGATGGRSRNTARRVASPAARASDRRFDTFDQSFTTAPMRGLDR